MSGRLALTYEIYAAFLFAQARDLLPPHVVVAAAPSVSLA